jgi:hypothetical protein
MCMDGSPWANESGKLDLYRFMGLNYIGQRDLSCQDIHNAYTTLNFMPYTDPCRDLSFQYDYEHS